MGRKSVLYADFFIPEAMAIVEVHGRQHYEYCRHFHKTKAKFLLAQQRDRDKIEWCRLNDIDIIALPYNEREQWKSMILKQRPRD